MLTTASVDPEAVAADAAGTGSWTRRQLVVLDGEDQLRGWVRVHDRAAGRTVVAVTVDPAWSDGALHAGLYAWAEAAAPDIARQRRVHPPQLDAPVSTWTTGVSAAGRRRRAKSTPAPGCT